MSEGAADVSRSNTVASVDADAAPVVPAAPAGGPGNEEPPGGPRWSPARHPDLAWKLVGGAVGVAVALWLTRNAWGPHVIAGGDISADLVRTDFGISELVLHGRLDGWFPRFMLGHQEFLFNGPGVTWAAAAIRGLTLGALSTSGAVKVLGLGALAAEPIAVAYLARSFGLDRVGAAIAGILSLAATTGYGLGLEGLFVNGLLSHQVGAIAFFVSFGAVLRVYDDPSRRRVVVAAVALAALMITHLISLMVLAVMAPIALWFRMSASDRDARREGIFGLLESGCVAFGLAAFWVIPFVVHQGLHGPIVTWGTDAFDVRIAAILRGQILYQPFVVKLVVVAWLIVLVRAAAGHRAQLVLLAVPTFYLVIAHVSLRYPGPGPVTLQLANRGLAYAGVIALFPVAALMSDFATWLGTSTGHRTITTVVSVVAIAAAAAIAIDNAKEHLAGELHPPTAAFRHAALELRKIVPPGARFSLTRDYPAEIARVGVVEPARWLAWASGVDTLNAFNPESSDAGAVSYTADGPGQDESVDHWVRALRRLGVSHVVVDTADLAQQLRGLSIARPVWSEGPLTIYRLRSDSGGRPAVLLDTGDGDARTRFTEDGPERLRWHLESARASSATIAVGWSPKWHAALDGHPLAISRTTDGLMQVALPAGRHTLALTFRRDAADLLGAAVTLCTLAVLVGLGVRRRWRRRRRPPFTRAAACGPR